MRGLGTYGRASLAVAALHRHMRRGEGIAPFGAFGDASVDPGDVRNSLDQFWAIINQQKATVQSWNDRLYAAQSNVSFLNSGMTQADLDNWRSQALNWMNAAGNVFDQVKQAALQGLLDPDAFRIWNDNAVQTLGVPTYSSAYDMLVQPWIDTGMVLIDNARREARLMNELTLANDVDQMMTAFPVIIRKGFDAIVEAVSYALKKIVKGVLDAGKEAAWGTAEIVLILGGAAALILFLLNKSGAKIGFGPLSVGK